MITIKEFMEIVDYKITEGSEYCWNCYGFDAYRLDSWNQEQDGHTVSIIFDTKTHVVYEATAYDYSRNRAYRLINPDYKSAHDQEAINRDVDSKQAWDDVNYVDLESDDDFIQKAQAIIAGEEYDTRVSVPLDLDRDELFELMALAHEKDMTLNQLVEEALQAAINKHLEKDDMRDEYDFSEAKPAHFTNTDDPIDFPKSQKKKHKKGKQ